MTGKLLFIRAHMIAFASYGFLTAVALNGLHVFSSTDLVVFIGVCVLVAAVGAGDESRRVWSGIRRGDLTRYGTVLGFCSYPRPGTSLLKALDRYAGVQPGDIEEVKMQTCGFSNPYLKSLSTHFSESGVPSDIPIEVMGVGEVDDLKEVAAKFPYLTITHSQHKLRTHFNLVKAKGHYYLWFEPDHNDSTQSYIPSKGAFLVRIEDDTEALARFEQDRDLNRFLSTSLVASE